VITAHRYAWIRRHGPIPPGLCVLHRCDNPPCVNVEHLFIGTQTDNMADMKRKSRQAKGRRFPQAKLSPESVAEIRSRYASGGVTHQTLADEFHVARQTIGDVIAKKYWA